MSAVVKAGLLLGGGSVIAAGSYFAISGLGYSPVTLNEESSTGTDYSNKIGNDFKHFLISPFNKKNEKFWKESHSELTQHQNTNPKRELSDDFKKDEKVKTAFTEEKTGTDNDKEKALNRVCDAVYKKTKSDLDLSDATKKKLTSDLFTYCSALKGLPKTVKEAAAGQTSQPYQEGKLGKTKEEKLIATAGNDTWWNLKTQEFFDGQDPTSDAFFSPFYQGKKGSLRTKCEEAYKLQSNTTSSAQQPTETEVLKYCSLLGS